MFRPYLTFLSQPYVARLFLIAALSRLPISMTALAMTLYLRATLGDFAKGGVVVGCYFVAMASASPVLGRLIDSRGPRLPLLITGCLQPMLLGLLVLAARWHWEYSHVLVIAIVAGLLPPPLTILTRTLWRHFFQEDQQRRVAYALDSVITELNFTLGPALIGVLVALTNATVAIVFTVIANFLAFVLFVKSRILEHWQPGSSGKRHWLGPLSDGRLVLYFCLGFGLTFCLGLFEVSYPAYALQFQLPALAGLLIALNCLGSALGGAFYGTWQSGRSVEQQFSLTLSALALPFVLHALLPQLPIFMVVAFFGGLAVAPALTSLTLLTTKRAPALYATEALMWSGTFIVSGLGCGMAIAGYFIETWSLTSTFWLGAGVAATMAGSAYLLQAQVKR